MFIEVEALLRYIRVVLSHKVELARVEKKSYKAKFSQNSYLSTYHQQNGVKFQSRIFIFIGFNKKYDIDSKSTSEIISPQFVYKTIFKK